MKITIIIPTYNRADTLPHSINSLLKQANEFDLDILVVDDGSTDETPTILADLSARHSQLRVIRQENGGVTAARNTGLKNLHPEADLVTFLDSDDLSPKNRFSGDVGHFVKNPALEATYGRMTLLNAFDYDRLCPADTAKCVDVVSIHLSCALFRRSLVERIGLFDLDFAQAEDTDYILRVFEANTNFLQTDTMCLYYLRHPGNMTKDVALAQRSFVLAIRKSILRRKANPALRLVKPDFEIQALKNVRF